MSRRVEPRSLKCDWAEQGENETDVFHVSSGSILFCNDDGRIFATGQTVHLCVCAGGLLESEIHRGAGAVDLSLRMTESLPLRVGCIRTCASCTAM